MQLQKKNLLVYAVTDRRWTGEQTMIQQIEEALQGGATIIQLREKNLDEEAFLEEAIEVKKICQKYQVPLIINDNVEVALKSGADGVHVGQSDMAANNVRRILGPDKIIGVSAATVEEAIYAEKQGANYLGVGAVFPTSTKDNTRDVDYDRLKSICSAVDIPAVAIGGITKENLMQLKGSGIAGTAVVSAIFGQNDIRRATADLREQVSKMLGSIPTALSIAGSDSSGGAGIQADIKTMIANNVYAMTAITALTAQNTTGVAGIYETTPEFLAQQLDCIFTDIFPDAVKIGMVSSVELIHVIADKLKEYGAKHIVLDPVMVATSGSKLISEDAVGALKEQLIPLAQVITPNIPEAEVLAGRKIDSADEMLQAAKIICENYGCNVLVKGGHQLNDANDLLYTGDGFRWFYGERIDNPNTHGTGCTLSSAIASNLAKGYSLEAAVQSAKEYLSGALRSNLDLGKGSGPLDHGFIIR